MPENIEDIYELSPMQQGILFDSLYAPDSGAYNLQLSCLLRGDLNVEAFERAWQQVVNRHTSLRTSFHWEELDKPLQLVSEHVKLPLEYLDWRGPSRDEQRAMRDGFLRTDYRRGYDITSAPLMRLTLIRLEDDLHHFVWSYHHLITDGWSGPLIFKEVFTFYCAFSRHVEVKLPPSRPYGDYISWLQEQDPAPAELFWRQALKGFTSPNVIQIEQAGSAEPEANARDAQYQLKLSDETTAALRRATQQHQLTLNTIVQGAWAILVARYSGKADVVFGAVVSNRPAEVPGVEEMVGVFINTLPVRAQIAWDESVVSWLKELQRHTAQARQYEYTPLVQVQGWSDVPRGVPLFETVLIFENYPMDAAGGSESELGLEITEVQTVDRNSFPLSLMVEPGSQLSLQLIYDQRRYNLESVSRLLEHLKLLLEGIIADPARRLSQLPLLIETERRQLFSHRTATQQDYARDALLHELIEEQVERTPEATAVVFEGRQFTYRELNERANQLAAYLRSLGVASESRVAVLMDRSAELLVALLGILKVGAAYVPLDPEYPQDRLSFMLEDSQAEVVLTQQPQLERHDWVARIKTRVVPLDTDAPIISQCETASRRAGATADDLAYVIYTSGSTGKPKGVQIPHRAVVNFMAAMQQLFNLSERDVLFSVTSLSFDIAGLELYLPLLAGAQVWLASRDVTIDAEALRGQLSQSGATIMQATPSTWRMLLETKWEGDSRLKILCGGEALPRELAGQLVDRCGELWNMYGPTETTIWSLSRRIEADHSRITIGFPIANTQVYVLDEEMMMVPVGVSGELYIGGDGLARGYLRRPGLTAERFVPDPHASEPGRRLYRTGDLVRYLPDGSIEFLGRIDHQVKIRGHRIEMGEIEAALDTHPRIRQSVVLAREDVPGDKRLVAYLLANPVASSEPVVAEPPAEIVASELDEVFRYELRGHLRERLPEYMVPSAFMFLPRLPLTPNGKVDRKALPAPVASGTKRQGSPNGAPRSHLEDALASLWAEVLVLESVAAADNFFELGGHSLLAMQVVSRVRDRLGAEVGVGRLFAAPTLAGFAAEVERALREGEGLVAPPLVRVERQGQPLPLSFAQQRLWFLEQLEPGTALYNIPAAVRLKGPLETEALQRALEEIVKRHEVLRTSFVIEGGEPAQVIATSAPLTLAVEEVPGTEAAEREGWVHEEAQQEAGRGFDLGSGPLMRVRLLRLSEAEHVALLTMHHIVSDGWSMGVFVRELAALYEAFVAGRESPLPELGIQYADYAVWQREWLRGEVLERQLGYWRRQLEGAPGAIELPADYTRPAVQTYRGASESGAIGETVSGQLRELSRGEGVTLYVTMLAAFKALLWRYGGGGAGGADDVVVGTPVAGRGRMETEGLVGFFVNTLVLRTKVGDNPTFRQLLSRVRDAVIEGHAHQDVPFEKLVEALQPERDMSRSPLFQVMFGWQAEPLHLSKIESLQVSAIESHTGTAKFDLTVIMDEGPHGLICSIEYNSDLFEAATIRRMLGHYRLLLESVVTGAEQKLAELTLLTDSERRQILVEWNDTETDYSNAPCVHKAFEAQVERTPDALALTYEGEHLTYRELNTRANRLAHRLRRLGVGPEVRVGIYVDRSLAMVTALLGVLKAGGAYVPLDPEYPRDRFAFMLHDVQPKVLLTQEKLLSKLPPHHAEVIRLDADWGSFASESDSNPDAGVAGGNLCYVIYTSGSTGQPKGVMNTHQGVINRLLWMQQEFALSAEDCVLQKTPFSFDVSVWEFFWPLLAGARLVLARPGGHRDGAYLIDLINREQITHLHFVPPMLQSFLNEPRVETCVSVRRVICSGEALSAELQEQFHRRLGARLYNLYGPTEAAIDVSHWACRPGDDVHSALPFATSSRAADLCLHEIFEAQVERTPDSVAVMFEDEQLTYRELNGLANQIAHRLRRLGVGPETRLSIYLEPSLGMVAGLLGVLKAGGAYVPLDPSHPPDRLSYIVQDAQVKVMLTQEYLLPVLPVHDTQVVCLDSELSGIVSESVEKARSGVTAENLAYIIYTSGSTGKPKGVMVTHRAVCNHMLWMQSKFPLRGDDRLLQKTTFSFDASIWELFLPLMCGARLVMAAPGGQRDSAYLVESIIKQQVTVLQMVPSMLQVLLEEPAIEKCESLRLVFCGGESLPLELMESFRAHLGWVELHNLYGPTEAAIDVSHLSCGRSQSHDSGLLRQTGADVQAMTRQESNLDQLYNSPLALTDGKAPAGETVDGQQKDEPPFESGASWRVNGAVPIGRPIANTQLYILDSVLEPVPVGVNGELYIGGVQLARGYLRRPGLTAERFVPDPHASEPGRRLYRTGDVARYLPDGNLVFVGRRDQQVKVRGYRIEMGEIEAALDTHPRIRQSVVLAREDVPGDKRLVAYLLANPVASSEPVVAEPPAEIVASELDEVFRYELRGHLRERLPEYMVPSAFMFLPRLPLTPNGKVDRKALPAPVASGTKRQGSPNGAPRSHLEDALASLWAEVLVLESVAAADNFFELGGHSLLAMQVVSRVRDRLGAEVGVGRLFAAPTLAGFAAEVERALREGEGLVAPPLVRVERQGQPLPLSFAQQRLWFLEQLEPGTALYNIPAAVRLKGPLETEALQRALEEIVKRHEVLRTSFVIEGGEPAQVIATSAPLTLAVEEVPGTEAAEREGWVHEEAQQEAGRGFDLGSGPLMRVRLLRLSEAEHVALLTMHHIVSDGWSMGVFVRELAALYEAFVAGRESPLPELGIQYADYAVWQREWLRGEVLERQLGYWRRQLEGAPGAIELPADYTRPAVQTYRGASESGAIGETVSGQLRELSRGEGVTLYVTMLAAFKALLWRYGGGGAGGADDVVVGTPVAGRGRMETEGLVGFFVNTLVLRTKVGDNPTFRQLLKQVRAVVLGAYNHQDLPFVKLVEALNPERQPGYSPLVQVCFFLDTGPMALLELPGLTLSPVETSTGVAQFDLILGVSDTGPRLSTNMQYNADVFAPATIRHILSLYETLLSQVVAQPEIRLDQLNRVLAEADEQQRILREKKLEELSFGNLRRIKRKVVGDAISTGR